MASSKLAQAKQEAEEARRKRVDEAVARHSNESSSKRKFHKSDDTEPKTKVARTTTGPQPSVTADMSVANAGTSKALLSGSMEDTANKRVYSAWVQQSVEEPTTSTETLEGDDIAREILSKSTSAYSTAMASVENTPEQPMTPAEEQAEVQEWSTGNTGAAGTTGYVIRESHVVRTTTTTSQPVRASGMYVADKPLRSFEFPEEEDDSDFVANSSSEDESDATESEHDSSEDETAVSDELTELLNEREEHLAKVAELEAERVRRDHLKQLFIVIPMCTLLFILVLVAIFFGVDYCQQQYGFCSYESDDATDGESTSILRCATFLQVRDLLRGYVQELRRSIGFD